MACTVKVAGEKKAKFEAFEKEYGTYNALQSLLNETERVNPLMIPGFISNVEQTERKNAIKLMTLNYIKDDPSIISLLDLRDNYKIKDKLDTIKDNIKADLAGIIQTASENYDKGINVEDNAFIANRVFVLYKNLDQVFNKVLKDIKNLGFNSDAIEDVDTEITDPETTENDTYIYGRSQHEKSPIDTAKGIVSLYLSTKNKTVINSDGEVADVLDSIGLKVPLNLNETYAEVFRSLANIRTIEGMIAKLKEEGRTKPLMASIASDLENNKMESSKPLMYKGQKVLNFQTAFFTTFRKSYSDFTTILTSKKEDINGEKYLTVQSIKSNANRQDNKIKKQWIKNNMTNSIATLEKKRAKWNESVASIFQQYDKTEIVGMLNDTTNIEILKPVQALLSSLGIETNISTLQEIRLRDKDRNQSFFNRVLGTPTKKQGGISYESLAKKFWVDGEDIFTSEGTTISSLAWYQSHNVVEVALQAFLNDMGNLVYPLNLPTSTTDLFDELSNNDGRYLEFVNDPMMGKTRIVRMMYDNAEQKTIRLSKLSAYKTAEAKEGIEFSDMSPLSNIAMRLGAFANPNKNGEVNEKTGELLFPTPSDKSNSSTIILPKLTDVSVISGVLIGDPKSNQSFKRWLIESAEMEFDRIKRAYAKYTEVNGDISKLIKDYHYNSKGQPGAAMSFNYYPALNKFLKFNNGVVEDIDFKSPEVIKALSDSIIESFKADIDYMIQKGVLTKGSTLESMEFTPEAKQLIPTNIQDSKIVLQFLANTIAVNHETSLLFTGDLAYFPIGTEQFNKANKRSGLAETPGEKLMIGEGGSKPTYQVSFMHVPAIESKEATDINKFLGVEKSAYNSVDVTDGQGFCTLNRYADLLKGRGMLSEEIVETLAELEKNATDVEWRNVNARLETTKGFVHTNRYDPNFNMVVTQNLKYSVMPIFPAMFRGNATMETLYNKMIANGVDELNFTSTAKMGAYNINTMQTDALQKVTYHNEDYRIPQIVAYKDTIEQNAGSQIRKSITGNLEMEGSYSPRYSIEAGKGAISGQQLEDNYQEAMRLNIENDYTSIMDSLSTKGIVDPLKIANKIVRTLDEATSSSTPSHIAESLSTVQLPNGTKTTLLPLSFPAIKTKVESTLFSIFNKKVTKKKMPGFVGVQYTSLGYDVQKDAIETDNTLRWVREENGVVYPAEIKCSPVYFLESLKKMEQTPEVIETIKQLHDGTFDPKNLKGGLNEIVIYRIPYQGLSSSVPCRIKAFTPEAAGVTITVPMEMIAQAGIDFDIDKVYVEIKHFNVVENELYAKKSEMTTREGRNNMIVDTHYTVLTDIKHYAEMITPNNTNTLSALKTKYLNLYGNQGFGKSLWGSLAVQESLRNEGKDGGVFIGISADAATFHSIWDKIGATQISRFSKGANITVNGKSQNVIKLGAKYNNTGGLISNEYGEVMNVSVDNAKDPILGNLNINTITGPAYLWLVEAGAGLPYATALINTPIIRELVTEARNLEQLYGKEGSFNSALNTIAKKYMLSDETEDLYSLIRNKDFDITMKSLEALETNVKLDKPDLSRNQEALLAFLSFREYGNDLNKAKSALKIDVGGAAQSIAENLLIKQKLASIPGTYSSLLENNPLPVSTNSTITVNPERYAKHSLGHYEKYGILGAINLVSEVVHDNSATFNDMTKGISEKVSRLNGKDLRLIFNDYYTSLITSQGMFKQKNIIQIDLAKPNFVQELLGGELSFGTQTLALQALERGRMEAVQSYQPNKFLMSLTVEMNKDDLGVDVVSFDNSVIKAMSTDQKNDLATEFNRLFESSDDAEYEFGYSAVLYMLATEGFGRGINSYAELLPGNLFTSIYGADGVSIVDYFRSIEEQLKSPERTPEYEVYNHNFSITLLKNRATQMSGIQSMDGKSFRAKKGILSRLNFNDLVIDGTNILEKVGMNSDGSPIIQTLTELNLNRTVSGQYIQGVNTTLNQDEISKQKQSQQAGDSITNGECL